MINLGQKTRLFCSVSIFKGSLVGVLGLSLSAQAASFILPEKSSQMGPEGLALGGALVAKKGRGDFVYSNPASPAFEKKYSLGARYSSGGDLLGAQVVDTSSSALGGSIAYAQREFKNIASLDDASLGNFDRREAQVAIALMSMVSEGVAFGIAGRYHYVRPLGAALPNKAYWNGDVGVIVELSPQWTLGLSGNDLLSDETGFNYRSFSFGVAGAVSSQLNLLAQTDILRNPEGTLDTGFVKDNPAATVRAGVEYMVSGEIALRSSYAVLSSWESNALGFGLRYKKDKFALEYGLRINPESSKSANHAVAFSVDL